ncbi:tRNA (adenosine(37)-N6)-threonylcarbamoyltransferase complex ATPase subunit type 1 TsaE [Candidatus Campbellbacteria bacterium]|nr:MAG: tRNA (adenosine(37)-N6)-threonylcarbamoyltransferase complex ATPase subunit type 1 TsaE [Candidatus Campbellbacteria bacterium]
MKKYKIKNLNDLENFAKKFLNYLKKEKKPEKKVNEAKIVLLNGDLGAGKTAFVKKIAKLLNIKEEVLSPTFVISKEYKILKNDFADYGKLIHIDAYRLNTNDFKNINLNNQVKDSGNIIFIEWSDIFQKNLPKNCEVINFEYINPEERVIEFKR